MTEPLPFLIAAFAMLAGTGLAAAAALRGWKGWLELRRLELAAGGRGGGRTALRELRERVRRLEAIASGAD